MALKQIYTTELKGTPAAIDRRDGIIYINPDLFGELSHFEKRFVLLHEEGHYALDTSDEVAADAYAFDRMAGTEWQSLKKMIATLDRLLIYGNITRAERLFELYKRALRWDAERGNEEAAREYELLKHEDVLNGVSQCTETKVFGFRVSKKCVSDPTGDAQAKANTAMTYATVKDVLSSTKMMQAALLANIEEQKGDAERTTKLIMMAIAAVVAIVLLWEE